MWKADKNSAIFIHLGLVCLATFLITLLFFKVYLPFATNHNERIIIPALEGKTVAESKQILKKANLRIFIKDSTFVEGKGANEVLAQHPEAGSAVKSNRKIYVTITSTQPPKVKMPKLSDQSIKAAKLSLKSLDLRLGNIQYESSPYKDLVLGQFIKGEEILPGTYIPKGTHIDLTVGNGEPSTMVEIPYLVGKTKEEAITLLEEKGLIPGIIAFEKNTGQPIGMVLGQKPSPFDSENKTISQGSSIDIWVAEE